MRNKYLVFRLLPDKDLYNGIIENCVKNNIKAGCIVSAVGCVKTAVFRKADGESIHNEVCEFEVTSLSGTISEDGIHVHIQLCDNDLRSIGGHLKEGTLVNTTMEIVIRNLADQYVLKRGNDAITGYDELEVLKK